MSSATGFASLRLQQVKPSASVVVSQTARKLRAEGKDIIDLGIGEPDFNTPEHIVEAAHQAALTGKTRYTPMAGTVELKQAICDKFKRDNKLDFTAEQVFTSNGAKQVIFSALMATLNPGDEVLLCAPYFGCYRDAVLSIGATPITLPCHAKDNFRLTPATLQAAITDKTRWLLLNLPSNPAGAVYDKTQLLALGDVLQKHSNVLLMSDEMYEHIIFDDREFISAAKALPYLAERILTVNGVSKAYAMTGWRIGYCAGNQALIYVMMKVQSQISSAPCSIAQAAATEALSGSQDSVKDFREAFERRRNLVVDEINKIDGLSLQKPGGAFYAYVDCGDLIGSTTPDGNTIESDTDLASYLLNNAGVATVPGSAYEMSPYVRLSTANSDENLQLALARIAKAVTQLETPGSS